jgi:hypothetical protein
MTPAQLAGAGFLHTYWPFGAADADSRWLAEQAAVAQRLGDRFDLVSRALPLSVEVRLGGGEPGWTLGGADPVALNGFNRFALEVESNALMSDRLYLRFARRDRPDGAGPPPRVALEVACFAEAAGTGEGRRSLVLQGAALRDLVSAAAPGGGGHGLEADGSLALPPPIGGAGDDLPALVLRVPEAAMGWQGRVRIAFGLHLQVRPVAAGAPAPAAEEDRTDGSPPPRAQGWFDGLLGAASPLAPDVPVPLDPTAAEAAVVISHGWIVDTAAWRGPDAVDLVLEGPEGATRRFPAELVPRADIPRGFGRPIRGLTRVLCRVPLSALVLGRWRAAWEARFGGHPPVRVEAPGPVLLDVDDRQRPGLTLLPPPPAAAAAAPLPVAAE